jgi:hypothetical protein
LLFPAALIFGVASQLEKSEALSVSEETACTVRAGTPPCGAWNGPDVLIQRQWRSVHSFLCLDTHMTHTVEAWDTSAMHEDLCLPDCAASFGLGHFS